jgi:hypothetical protein
MENQFKSSLIWPEICLEAPLLRGCSRTKQERLPMKTTPAASTTFPARFFFRMFAAMLCAVFCLRVTHLHAKDIKPGYA